MKTNETTGSFEPIICERCGNKFSCGASRESCRCFGISLSGKVLSEMRARYKSCLCFDCLLNLKTKEKPAE